jgi:glycosyltransferase involved in cell wall biosynthesis
MEELKFSILACVYGNQWQFKNFLWTALRQDYPNYEVIIVDNAHPNKDIYNLCKSTEDSVTLRYFRIEPEFKKCKNIAQGINLAAEKANGEYLVIVADPNNMISFNLLKTMDGINNNTVMLSDISGDLRLSPTGIYDDEYSNSEPPEIMAQINEQILKEMGWPADPLLLELIPGKHRMAPPHLAHDCVVVALSKENYLKFGGYDESAISWGIYHELFVRRLAEALDVEFLKGIRVIHQYHRVLKDADFKLL